MKKALRAALAENARLRARERELEEEVADLERRNGLQVFFGKPGGDEG